MSEPMFTPAPWIAHRLDADDHDAMSKYVDGTIRVGGTQYFLVMGAHDDGRPADVAHTGNGPRSAANARLIAAAPDMYEQLAKADALLRRIEDFLLYDKKRPKRPEWFRDVQTTIAGTSAALAKATGHD